MSKLSKHLTTLLTFSMLKLASSYTFGPTFLNDVERQLLLEHGRQTTPQGRQSLMTLIHLVRSWQMDQNRMSL